jgi:SAM-dependent methyltransferase
MIQPNVQAAAMSADELRTRFRQQLQGAMSLYIAYVGVVNGLLAALRDLGAATPDALAERSATDAGYVRRWCDAAYAFGYLDDDGGRFRLSEVGAAMCPGASEGLMPMAVQSILGAHMAERAAGLMKTGERPGESVLAERETVLPWFGPMLEGNFGTFFERKICPAIGAFSDVDARGGLALDLGCGNGWYLRALARRYPRLRGLGVDGFDATIEQARHAAASEGHGDRLTFRKGDIHDLALDGPVDLIAMSRALHHVWERDPDALFAWMRASLKPGGYAVIWEPAWPDRRESLREPARRAMAFQNLSEHVQGNHFLRPQEIVVAFERVGMGADVHLFADGTEAVVVARCPD